MEELFVFVGFIAIFVIVVLPLVVISTVKTTDRRVRGMEETLKNMQAELNAALKKRENTVGTTAERESAYASAAPPIQLTPEPSKVQETPIATPVITPPIATPVITPPVIEPEKESGKEPEKETVQTAAASRYAPPGWIVSEEEVANDLEVAQKVTPIEPRVQPQERPAAPVKESKPLINTSIFTDNWMSKIGIITLVLGISFFVKYAIDQDWINEIGRVGIGILTGAVIIGIAHKLRKQYDVFSSILIGGGISVLYITITLAFREYQIFSQTAAFAMLIGITVFSVVLSLLYDRKELALFSLLGGYASPLMISTGAGNYVVLFSFILILNTGMLLISIRKHWPVIGVVSYVCSLAFFWGWLGRGFETQYVGATIFAVLFFVQFYLLGIVDHFRSKKITPFQVMLVLSNNLSLFFACTLIFNDYPTKVLGLATILIAAVNAVVMAVLIRRKEVDKNMLYLIIAIVMSFVSLAVPVQLNGHVITMFWAAEAVILLGLWQRSRIRVFHVGFALISMLTLISYFMDAAVNYGFYFYGTAAELPVIANRMFITGIVVIASLAICRWMLRRDSASAQEGGQHAFVMLALQIGVVVFAYLVPLLEIRYQLDKMAVSNFSEVAQIAYTVIYVAILAILYRRSLPGKPWMVMSLFGVIVMYVLAALPWISGLGYGVFSSEEASGAYFLIHYLALVPLIYIFYAVASQLGSLPRRTADRLTWLLVGAAVIVLSSEADNTAIQFWGNSNNYSAILHDTHTFGYPILWSVSAMVLMVWGLKRKHVLLRKISLVFFGFIILKFYVVDVWRMSQGGRILSFVVLGVILLLVSFLQQRIKTLVKDENKLVKEDDNIDKTTEQ